MTAVQVLGKDRSTAEKDERDGVGGGGAAGYVGGVGGDAAQSVCLLSSCYFL